MSATVNINESIGEDAVLIGSIEMPCDDDKPSQLSLEGENWFTEKPCDDDKPFQLSLEGENWFTEKQLRKVVKTINRMIKIQKTGVVS